MKKLSGLSALVSPRVLAGVGLFAVTSLIGGTGCGLSYSLTSLTIDPAAGLTCVPNGGVAQYTAYGTYTEGNHANRIKDVSSVVTWGVTFPQLAGITSTGLLTANNGQPSYTGTSNVTATTTGEFGVLHDTSNIQVSTNCAAAAAIARPFSLHVVTGNQPLIVGQTLQPLAIAAYPDGQPNADVTSRVQWSSSNPSVAVVDANGVISAVAAGDATITAQIKTAAGETALGSSVLHLQTTRQQQ